MKLQTILRSAVLVGTIAATLGDDINTKSDPSPSSTTGHEVISTPTYAQTMEDAIRELMEDFSAMTSLHESFVHHPLFSRHRMGIGSGDVKTTSSSKPFSTWGSFDSLTRWSPRYEVIDDPKTFQVKLDVPGFHFHEMKVELESGGRVLKISGTKEDNVHETTTEKEEKVAMGEKTSDDDEDDEDTSNKIEYTSHTSTSFQQKFTLDPSVDTGLMTANLVGGTLEVRAPRKHGAWNKRHVPITQFDEDVWAELIASDEEDTTVLKKK